MKEDKNIIPTNKETTDAIIQELSKEGQSLAEQGLDSVSKIGGLIVSLKNPAMGVAFKAIVNQISKLIKKKRIRDNYPFNKTKVRLSEYLEFIKNNNNISDEDFLEAVNAVFLASIEHEELSSYALFKMLRKNLDETDIPILKICYEGRQALIDFRRRVPTVSPPAKDDIPPQPSSADLWLDYVSTKLKKLPIGLIQLSEERLMSNHLISERSRDGIGITQQKDFRLSTLGIKLCEIITNYSKDKTIKEV